MLYEWFPNVRLEDLWTATYETLYMTIISVIGTLIFGIILGLLLFLTGKGGLKENPFFHFIVASFVNIFRAIPFIILILLLFPFTEFLVGTIRGPKAALPGPYYWCLTLLWKDG